MATLKYGDQSPVNHGNVGARSGYMCTWRHALYGGRRTVFCSETRHLSSSTCVGMYSPRSKPRYCSVILYHRSIIPPFSLPGLSYHGTLCHIISYHVIHTRTGALCTSQINHIGRFSWGSIANHPIRVLVRKSKSARKRTTQGTGSHPRG